MKATIRMGVMALLTVICFNSNAETIQFQVPACLSEDLEAEFSKYIAKNDTNGMSQLVKNGECTVLTKGDQVSVISRGFIMSEVRYQGVKLYVTTEAVGN